MDDPGEWSEPWPYWKFGLKQHDLHDSLHLRYNTVPSAIQDPEAFHHDVYELATLASDLLDFERLMEERKTLRLKELQTMLENASFQIVGCPNLIGTAQWPLAVQLFRTKSFDSLVRYFSSYLPDEHPWHRHSDSSAISGDSDADSPVSPSEYADYHGPVLFDEPDEDETFFTHAPSGTFSTCGTAVDLADQPARSGTMQSVDSGVSVTERKQRPVDPVLPFSLRHTTLSESEPERLVTRLGESTPALQDNEPASPSEEPDTPDTYVSEQVDNAHEKDPRMTTIVDDEDADGFLSVSHAQLGVMDTTDSDAPTPKATAAPTPSPASPAAPLFETKLSPLRSQRPSEILSHPHHAHRNYLISQRSRRPAAARQLRRRDTGIEPERRRSVLRERASRGRDVSADSAPSRARARRWRLLCSP